ISNHAAALVDDLVGQREAITTVPHAPVAGASVVFPDGTTIGRRFRGRPGYIAPRLQFDRLLRNALEPAGVEVREGVRIRALLRSGDRVVGATGDRHRFVADAVIAADGPGSVAWAALKVPYPRGRHLALAITA